MNKPFVFAVYFYNNMYIMRSLFYYTVTLFYFISHYPHNESGYAGGVDTLLSRETERAEIFILFHLTFGNSLPVIYRQAGKL